MGRPPLTYRGAGAEKSPHLAPGVGVLGIRDTFRLVAPEVDLKTCGFGVVGRLPRLW